MSDRSIALTPLVGRGQAMKAGLLTTTFLEAMAISQDKRSYKDTADDDALRQQIDVRTPP